MYLRSIRLRDWKAFAEAELEFPKPSKKKNVVLLGAMNGFGKTSLLEALMLGLFGRDGLALLARAVIQDGEQERLAQSYDEFLQRAFHARALEQGRSSASVEVVLEEGEERVKIQRVWHFSGNGKHRREEEEVRAWIGPDDDPVKVPRLEDKHDYLRGFIAQKFLPVHLAQFFLFDGEQVQRLAKREMSTQVRAGIEGILGVPILRELQHDLREYARARRNAVAKVGDETIERLRAEVRDLEATLEAAEQELGRLGPQLEPLSAQRDRLQKDLSSLHGGTHANLKELYETRQRAQRELDRARDALAALLREDLALAISGKPLRDRLRERLFGEEARAQWEAGKEQSKGSLSKLLSAVEMAGPPIEPPLQEPQVAALRERIRIAWESLWYPPPARCADGYRHTFLGAPERSLVAGRLTQIESLALGTIQELTTRIEEAEREIQKTVQRIAQQSGIDEKSKQLADEVGRLSKEVAAIETRIKELKRTVDGVKGQLNPKRQELAKLSEGQQRAQPQLKRSAAADKIADLLESVIEESYPIHIQEVAKEMTDAYRAMAHKTLLKDIQIAPDCTVSMLGDGGRDMRSMDASAGESQVFALALIAAIARVSDKHFPIVMDTPLARLDPKHRRRVLSFFTERAGEQVVLLSQPDEVGGEYLEAIKDRVCAKYTIEHEELGNGVGISRVVEGYFQES